MRFQYLSIKILHKGTTAHPGAASSVGQCLGLLSASLNWSTPEASPRQLCGGVHQKPLLAWLANYKMVVRPKFSDSNRLLRKSRGNMRMYRCVRGGEEQSVETGKSHGKEKGARPMKFA